jgi:hypothetical protein
MINIQKSGWEASVIFVWFRIKYKYFNKCYQRNTKQNFTDSLLGSLNLHANVQKHGRTDRNDKGIYNCLTNVSVRFCFVSRASCVSLWMINQLDALNFSNIFICLPLFTCFGHYIPIIRRDPIALTQLLDLSFRFSCASCEHYSANKTHSLRQVGLSSASVSRMSQCGQYIS